MSNSSIICFVCGYEPIYLEVSDEGLSYFCENCGWAKDVYHAFHVVGWYITIRQALAPIDVLQSLLTSEDIVKFLRPRLRGISHLSEPIPNFDLGDEYFRGEIDIAHKVYLSQMIVLALTYAENMIKDFYRCLFLEQPKRMNSVLSSDNKRASIYINEIIEAASKEEIINRLVERATSKSSSRKIDEIASTLIKDCKLTLQQPIVQDLKILNEVRNRIVHEGKLDTVDIEQVLNGYGQLMYLLYILTEAAIQYNLPFVDEIHFLDDFREKLQERANGK